MSLTTKLSTPRPLPSGHFLSLSSSGLKHRHGEVLNQFEHDLEQAEKRALEAEKLAESRASEFESLAGAQHKVAEDFRATAASERNILEVKLDELEAKVRELQHQLSQSRRLSVTSDGDFGSHEQQIDFLNSVIVDMQRKNDELRNRVAVLEEIGTIFVCLFGTPFD